MALDFAILDEEGFPDDSVPIGMVDHLRLMQRATPKEHFPLINRLCDYYADASFDASEIIYLKAELNRIDRETLEYMIDALISLISKAEAQGKGIEAIAD